MNAVYALYDNPAAVQRAVDGLRAAGVADADIQIMSSEPFEEYEFGHKDSASWIHWIAGLGGIPDSGRVLLTTSPSRHGRSGRAACRSWRRGRTSSSSSR
jgi:hypothetical protein